ncbi:MAG: helix-turn-helix transcriptional regulator [Gammaproteobacteria bacterium]|nr:helix-turn-helix transcriptional regulator [Gammaproteobacteria bacterium]
MAVAVAAGQTVAGVADALDCAESTVKTHLKRVYRKLGIRKQTELAQRVLSLESLRGSGR